MLKVGIKGEGVVLVDRSNSAKTMGSGTLDVFATPAMAQLMEKTALQSVQPELEEGEGTVGIRLSIDHVSATPLGMKVRCQSELIGIEGRKLIFRVEAYDDAGLIGQGTHERFVVQEDRFLSKAERKKKTSKDAE